MLAVAFDVLEPEVQLSPADVRPELDRSRCRRLVLLRLPQARRDVGRVRYSVRVRAAFSFLFAFFSCWQESNKVKS